MKKLGILFLMISLALVSQAQTKGKAKKATKATAEKVEVFTPASKDPLISLSSETLDYGTVTKGADGLRTFEITNKGGAPLLISNCTGSCGCTVPTCPKEPILPGKSAKIEVRYDTNRVGPIAKSVSVMSNDPMNPVKTFNVRGEVKE
jgi:hypothetical protein